MNKQTKKKSDFSRFLRRFKRNKLAVFGACFLTILIIVAILANIIAPGGYDQQTSVFPDAVLSL